MKKESCKNSDRWYREKEKLKSAYRELGTRKAVAEKFGVTPGTISHWKQKHGIEHTGCNGDNKPDPRKDDETPWRDKKLLRDALERNEGVFTDTAEDIGTSRKTVARWVDRLDIDVPEPPWVSEGKLREEYHRLGSLTKVAEELGYNHKKIKKWLDEYGIEIRKGDPTSGLYDAEKMRQYYEEEQSVKGVQSRLQGSPGSTSVLKWLRKHGVELNHDHATRGER